MSAAAATSTSTPASVPKAEKNRNIMSATGIVNRFGKQTVHDGVDLDVKAGEVLGIAGGSGSGKSVLLRTLAGLNIPKAGKVMADGRPVAELTPAERAAFMGMLFQHGALFSSLTVAENITLPMREHTDLEAAEREVLAAIKLGMAGLDAGAGAKFPSELSGGMVKRAALARALALDPRVLMLDEPTAGLDPGAADGIDELIEQLNSTLGVTVVVVTHDLNTLFGVCDRVAVLANGKITVGTPEKMLRSKEAGVHDFLSGTRVETARAAANLKVPAKAAAKTETPAETKA
ncbi:MAG: ATP-binding cassette domain-containing protein [Betaproteobacteria bacterium]